MNFFTRFRLPRRKGLFFDPDSSLTFQSMKDETDINLIIKSYKETGTLPNSRPKPFSTRYPMFGDFSGVTDYSDAVNAVNAANEAFLGLPSAIRKRFDNDPMKLVKFLENAENRKEAEQLGLIEKSIVPVVKPSETTSSVQNAVVDTVTASKEAEKSVVPA